MLCTKRKIKMVLNKMIYIVDDNQYVREGFMSLLKSAGFTSNSFGSAAEFLKSYQHGEKDLLLLDMNMPQMSGCYLLENLQKEKIVLPVIIITSFDDKVYRDCAKNYGALAYLRKPVDSEALIDLIKFYL